MLIVDQIRFTENTLWDIVIITDQWNDYIEMLIESLAINQNDEGRNILFVLKMQMCSIINHVTLCCLMTHQRMCISLLGFKILTRIMVVKQKIWLLDSISTIMTMVQKKQVIHTSVHIVLLHMFAVFFVWTNIVWPGISHFGSAEQRFFT